MKEAEVSIRIALYYICNNITKENVRISIDGAHIKTNDTVHFDIFSFLKENGCRKVNENGERLFDPPLKISDFARHPRSYFGMIAEKIRE